MLSDCSSSEVGSVLTYVEKVTKSWVVIRISFEVCQKLLVFIRPQKVYLFANLETTVISHLIIMICY